MAHTEPILALFFLGILIMIGGFCAILAAGVNWGVLKQEMVDYAYRRAAHEGTEPNLSFLFFFDNRFRGPAEWEILRRAYDEMRSWNPEPVVRYGDLDRPYRMVVVEEARPDACASCRAARKSEDRFCSRCGAAFTE